MSKVLLIEDDVEICELLTDYLSRHAIEVSYYIDPLEALEALKKESYDIVILDIMLPNMNGLDVCQKIKALYDIPIIISSARGKTSDKVLGLETGADDYLPKPYEPMELIARIHAVLRRYVKLSHVGDEFEVDTKSMTIRHAGKTLDLTNSEYELMKIFLENKNTVLNRDDIANGMESLNWDSTSRSIDVLVSKLRTKLGDDPKNPKFIKSVWGIGYKYIGS